MNLDPADEPAIDMSLAHYMEARALDIALDKASAPELRARLQQLQALRAVLMQQRSAYLAEAVANRHARGEVYSKARVAAINAMGPGRPRLEDDVKTLYLRQANAEAVLKAHARAHFVYGLMSSRLLLASHTADILAAARLMQQREEAFASAWVAVLADAPFLADLRRLQREALAALRTSTRPMHLVSEPVFEGFDDLDAESLGKAWKKLDELAQELGQPSLSSFIAVPDEGPSAGVKPGQVLSIAELLLQALQSPSRKFPSKRATVAVLGKLCEAMRWLAERDGHACFEIDL